MTRNLKTLGIALAAVFAMSAVVASAASAKYHFESDSTPTTYLTSAAEDHVFSANGTNVECNEIAFEGSQSGETASSVTIEPLYNDCEAFGLKADVIENGCHYTFTTPTTTLGTDEFTGAAPNVNCGEEGFEITPTFIGFSVCTVTIGSQEPGGHVIYHNAGTSGAMDVEVTSDVTGVDFTSTGGACGEDGNDGTYKGDATVRGYSNEAHTEATNTTISHTATE
jgi:hypothetical protein